ncbi:PIG-L deacetylase family protein [Plantactinospora sp. KLBMP9567]|uniref:PIG-L deacetylase family protein n=1 Tax=Plantactinospora sp. KLBMP9567 TaxID=3085900 RepID=UPI0029828E42|nr:PIG-L deacetylase family protein [Plantactinospora sp. KLBMP9567]MDW5325326.1 PIG-L deacetylase family protein [Plantactinospora sp. KLBMP9567]
MTASPIGRGPILVVSAHAADFVWRAGGAIALGASRGQQVHVLCLTFGEKGESQGLWKQPGMTLERVKEARRDEAGRAAKVLGAEIEFLDAGDYPLRATDALYDSVVATIRRVNPAVIITHPTKDPYNLDHALTHEIVLRARMVAQAAGHDRDSRPIGAPNVLQFEPHQPEQCGFVPNLLLDISPVFERKVEAMRIMGAQGHLVAYYTDLGVRRGVQAVRNGGDRSITHAEAYQRVFPVVGGELL